MPDAGAADLGKKIPFRRWRGLLLLGIPIAWCVGASFGWLNFFESKFLDWRFRYRGEIDAPIKGFMLRSHVLSGCLDLINADLPVPSMPTQERPCVLAVNKRYGIQKRLPMPLIIIDALGNKSVGRAQPELSVVSFLDQIEGKGISQGAFENIVGGRVLDASNRVGGHLAWRFIAGVKRVIGKHSRKLHVHPRLFRGFTDCRPDIVVRHGIKPFRVDLDIV